MLDAGRRERSEGASREERRTDFHQGGFSGQWKSNWNYCLMTEIRKVENGSFSEKPTAAAAGGGAGPERRPLHAQAPHRAQAHTAPAAAGA